MSSVWFPKETTDATLHIINQLIFVTESCHALLDMEMKLVDIN
jgi:hypothetical protein